MLPLLSPLRRAKAARLLRGGLGEGVSCGLACVGKVQVFSPGQTKEIIFGSLLGGW